MALNIKAVLHIGGKEIFSDNSYEYKGNLEESFTYYHPSIFSDVTRRVWSMFRLPTVIIMPTIRNEGVTETRFRLRPAYVLDKEALEHRLEDKSFEARRNDWRSTLSGSDYFNKEYSEPSPYNLFVPYDLEDIVLVLGDHWRDNASFHKRFREMCEERKD